MAMQTIKTGGSIGAEIAKVNANFTEIQEDYAKKTEIPTVPTKTSDLQNDSGFITSAAIPAVPTKVSQLQNDSGFITSTAIANKLAGLSAPTKVTFTTNNWTNGTFTTATTKNPAAVMRKDGTNYYAALVDVKTTGSSVVLTSDEAFDGYIVLI